MKFTITQTINKPVADVFRYLTSPAKMGEWMKDFQSIKPIKGRRSQVGGRSKIMMKDASSAFALEEKVIEFERNKRFKVEIEHSEMTTIIDYQLGGKDEKTVLVAKYHIGFKNIMNGVFALFFKIPMRNQQREDLARLKKKIEKL